MDLTTRVKRKTEQKGIQKLNFQIWNDCSENLLLCQCDGFRPVLPRPEQARRRAGSPQAGSVDTGGQGQPTTRSTQLGRAVDTEGASHQPMLRAVSLRLNSIYDTEQGPTDTLGPHRRSGSPLDPVDAVGSRRGAPRAPISSRTRSVAPVFASDLLSGRWPTEAAR